MADTSSTPARRLPQIPKAWLAVVVLLVLVALLDWRAFWPTVVFAADALAGTAPFILIAVLAVALLKATGAETLLARAFEGREVRMIFLAAILGGIAPFCSCQIIPFIAALLAVGAPLSAVMALWLSSPLMDPAMFSITAGTLGFDFALAKTALAIGLGLTGGFVTMAFARGPVFANPLREQPKVGGCCGVKKPFQGKPVWRFWQEPDRVATFRDTAMDNALFLLKWLTLAYVVEALMVRYVPAELIAGVLGGNGLFPIALGAVVGAPAYLNGYAAVPLVDALLAQGMAPGAAMSFMIAGGISSIPAMIAVWALVKPRVFGAYMTFGLTGAMASGLIWSLLA